MTIRMHACLASAALLTIVGCSNANQPNQPEQAKPQVEPAKPTEAEPKAAPEKDRASKTPAAEEEKKDELQAKRRAM